jgi:hypothetical protein
MNETGSMIFNIRKTTNFQTKNHRKVAVEKKPLKALFLDGISERAGKFKTVVYSISTLASNYSW